MERPGAWVGLRADRGAAVPRGDALDFICPRSSRCMVTVGLLEERKWLTARLRTRSHPWKLVLVNHRGERVAVAWPDASRVREEIARLAGSAPPPVRVAHPFVVRPVATPVFYRAPVK